MLTIFKLHFADDTYELKEDDLKNWDDIQCSFKRESYDGIVRSFTSQFEFVNTAKKLILGHYLQYGYDTHIELSVLTMDNLWRYTEQFRAPLDLSSVSWDDHVLSVNCVDNALAALIKANKGTKYEFAVGTDILSTQTMQFDRVPMRENVVYEFTQGTPVGDTAALDVTFERGKLPFIGTVGNEVVINRKVYWQDDQDIEPTSYLLRAEEDVAVSLEWHISYNSYYGEGETNIAVRIRRNGQLLDVDPSKGTGAVLMTLGGGQRLVRRQVGTYENPGQLPDPTAQSDAATCFAIVADNVWVPRYTGSGFTEWTDTGKTLDMYFTVDPPTRTTVLNLKKYDQVLIESTTSVWDTASMRILSSNFTFRWMARGEVVPVSLFSPKVVAEKILNKITDSKLNVEVDISQNDARIPFTYIVPAECARGLEEARLYSSFTEFCDWMSTVFGYVYYLGEREPSKFIDIKDFNRIINTPYNYVDGMVSASEFDPENIIFFKRHGRFLCYRPYDGKYYLRWPGYEFYTDVETGRPRTDTLFRCEIGGEMKTYFFNNLNMAFGEWQFPIESYRNDIQKVHFVHRSELFGASEVREVKDAAEVSYQVESGSIYSAVTIGYEKKEYQSVNGRDEFNFNNTYTTGCTANDSSTLSLLSKYRADCYGLEFAVQKRGDTTTDQTSDQDVFFVLVKNYSGVWKPDRSLHITGTATESVFNGAFSPMECVRANEGYIGKQAKEMTLAFASSVGNSDAVIGGEPMTTDLTLSRPLFTCGMVEFHTDEVDDVAGIDELIQVRAAGLVYTGFLREVDLKYARPEAAIYKIIVKEISYDS